MQSQVDEAEKRFKTRVAESESNDVAEKASEKEALAQIIRATCAQARCVLCLHGTMAERRAVKIRMKRDGLTSQHARIFVNNIVNSRG